MSASSGDRILFATLWEPTASRDEDGTITFAPDAALAPAAIGCGHGTAQTIPVPLSCREDAITEAWIENPSPYLHLTPRLATRFPVLVNHRDDDEQERRQS